MVFGRQIGQREMRLHVARLDHVVPVAVVTAGAGALEGDGHVVVLVHQRHPAHLHVAEERHPTGTPVLQRVREDVDVHERAPVLAGTEVAPLQVGMAQTDGGLTGITTDTEEFPFEDAPHVMATGRSRCLDPETGLPHAEVGLPVLSVLILVTGQLRRPDHVEPVRVDPPRVVTGVRLHEAVHLSDELVVAGDGLTIRARQGDRLQAVGVLGKGGNHQPDNHQKDGGQEHDSHDGLLCAGQSRLTIRAAASSCWPSGSRMRYELVPKRVGSPGCCQEEARKRKGVSRPKSGR